MAEPTVSSTATTTPPPPPPSQNHSRSGRFRLLPQRHAGLPPPLPQHRSRRPRHFLILLHRRRGGPPCLRCVHYPVIPIPRNPRPCRVRHWCRCLHLCQQIPWRLRRNLPFHCRCRNSRSINNSNVLAVSGMATSPDSAIESLDTWLKTPFKSPCPASNSAPWGEETESFLDNSLSEMPVISTNLSDPKQEEGSINASACALCCLVKNRKLDPIEIIPGGPMKIVRESPTSAIVSFKAGSVEPAHHHTFGHDLVVLKGSKRVWNLSKKAKYDLVVGDYLFTPAGDVHRVKYFEDTEFFIKWEGKWDIFFDEEMEVAKSEISKEADDGFELVK
ncbi:hypothetical protein OIU76_025085 [Salix suchowensis]|nr:hypothetical protein OIU76_025085 [Salix suchowensis]